MTSETVTFWADPATAPGRRATGNITNAALLALFSDHLGAIVAAFDEVDFVELRPTALILHGARSLE